MAALEGWQPTRPHHDPQRAFSLALLNARESTVLYVSDRKPESLPAGVQLLACGAPLENCGFVGQKTWRDSSGRQWQALVKASGAGAQERSWWFETEKVRSQVQTLRLEPGQIATIAGPFPPGESQLRVLLSADEFPMDDVLPLIAAEPKPLGVFVTGSPARTRLAERIIETIPGARRVNTLRGGGSGDRLRRRWIGSVLCGREDRLRFSQRNAGNVRAPIAAEKHPLTEGLVWDGLLMSGRGPLELAAGDQPLVWQRGDALVFLRTSGGTKSLFLNFDVEKSNADRLPSFVLLLSRFLAAVQAEKPVSFSGQLRNASAAPCFGNWSEHRERWQRRRKSWEMFTRRDFRGSSRCSAETKFSCVEVRISPMPRKRISAPQVRCCRISREPPQCAGRTPWATRSRWAGRRSLPPP